MFCDFIQRLTERADKDPATAVLDDMMEAIHYEAYLYDAFDERQAQSKWQNVLEFLEWLKRKGTKPETEAVDGEAEGFHNADGAADTGKNLLGLIQTVALMSMLEGKDEDPDAVRLSTVHASKSRVSARVPGWRRGRHHAAPRRLRGRRPDRQRADRGGAPADVRRDHARAAQPAPELVQEAQAGARDGRVRTVALHPGDGADDAPPPTPEEAPMSPKDRLASLKALLQK